MIHTPVLQKEVLKYLDPKPNENFIDCTIGEAGHSLAILEKTAPKGKILGIDWNPEIIQNTHSTSPASELAGGRAKYKNRLILICDNFANLKQIIKEQRFERVSGILFDLGMSSWHLEESGKGFSFLRKEFLDMRYNPENPQTAEKIINYWSKNDIEKILTEYGEEQFAKIIANEIIKTRKARPIKTTFELVEIIKKVVPGWYQRQRTNFATRTFQALRIAVNDELNNLKKVLPQTIDILKPGGRLVIISFHSLEDRIAKSFLKENSQTLSETELPFPLPSSHLYGNEVEKKESSLIMEAKVKKRTKFSSPKNSETWQKGHFKILTKKPVRPSTQELNYNPRSRSARLRAAIKI